MQQLEELRKQFITPSDEYTAIPFWFWNDRLTFDEIRRQIHSFVEKGIMGFVIHPRLGIPKDIEYLSDEFFKFVKFAVNEAKSLGMTVILYDEAMYPSGCAHGLVVKNNPELASKGLQQKEYPLNPGQLNKIAIDPEGKFIAAFAIRKLNDDTIDTKSTVRLQAEEGNVSFETPADGSWSIVILSQVLSRGTIRGIHYGEDDHEENAPKSSDLLNPEAVKSFIRITHDKYYSELKEFFGTTIMAFFTDEPAIMGRCHLKGLKAWTDDFVNEFINEGNTINDLPLLWLNGEGCEKVRKGYDTAINKRMRQTYYGPLHDWCEAHSIALAGHPEKSWEIGMMKFFHIPGQDVVWRFLGPENDMGVRGEHSVMAKCSSDAARHFGNRRNANECFGACSRNKNGWNLPPEDIKWYMDWLFIRGVNLLYPHAFFYSIDGRSRFMERPPDVGPNNIWWPYFGDISLYIKRMSWLMTDSNNTAQIAILSGEEYMPWQVAEGLYKNQLEFNYLEDELLFDAGCKIADGKVNIRNNAYSVIVVEDLSRFSGKTIAKLGEFIDNGGKVIALGSEKAANKITVANGISDLVELAEASISKEYDFAPKAAGLRVSEVVKDGVKFLALCNEGEEAVSTTIRLKACKNAQVWEPWGGKMYNLRGTQCADGWTESKLNIERRQIIIVVEGAEPNGLSYENIDSVSSESLNIGADGWKASVEGSGKLLPETLGDWAKVEGMEHFSGSVVYEKKIEYKSTGSKAILDLGEAYDIAHVYVNGKDAGAKLWAPYSFDITKFLVSGENTIAIKVTNSMANYYEEISLESGLIGPVKININQ